MSIETQNQQRERIRELTNELNELRAGSALVVHALNCAIQLTDALIAYTPDGSPLHPNVAAAKGALDQAMHAIHHQVIKMREP